MKEKAYILDEFYMLYFKHDDLPDEIKSELNPRDLKEIDGEMYVRSESLFMVLYKLRVQSSSERVKAKKML